MKPVIGITGSYQPEDNSYFFKDYYVTAISEAGGLSVLLPATADAEIIDDYLRICQGLVFSGGGDLDPVYWGGIPHQACGEIDPLRDQFEIILAQKALIFSKPTLGICRGCQVLATAAGGSLEQDICTLISHNQKAPRNHSFHDIFIESDSHLSRIVGNEHIRVNSFHHQAIRQPGRGLRVIALAADGTVEAIESGVHPFYIGVQWHPECLQDKFSIRLFAALIASAE